MVHKLIIYVTYCTFQFSARLRHATIPTQAASTQRVFLSLLNAHLGDIIMTPSKLGCCTTKSASAIILFERFELRDALAGIKRSRKLYTTNLRRP